MVKFLFSLAFSIVIFAASAQTIQWNHRLLPADVNQVANDTTEKGRLIFQSRMFLLDSIKGVSKETHVPFFDNGYRAFFSTPQEVSHLVINFKDAARLMYYIRLFDEKGVAHMVYDYGAIHPCNEQTESLLLTIARTSYKVTEVEIGTYLGKDDFIKIGISNERDINVVIEELLNQRQKKLCIKTSFFSDKVKLPTAINSGSDEVKPVISADGKTLYFHRQNFKGNVGGKKDDQDIYVSRLVNNTWTDAENMKAPLNDNLPNGIASVSSSETSLFLINEYVSANQQRQGLSVSNKTIDGWSFPEKVDVINFYNRSAYIDYFISASQSEMILAIQRDDSYGDQDLYVSFFDDGTGKWSEPLNLGPEVNTFLSEASPFLAADSKTLYFASDGGLGYGGFDIYVTHRLDESWTKWSAPENLGPIVNSDNNDLYYTISAAGDHAYFVSTENKDRNIFSMGLPTIYKPEPVVLLSGKIFNAETGFPEEAQVNIKFYGDSETIGLAKSDPLTGEYKIVLPAGGVYNYEIEKAGFSTVKGTINTLNTKRYEEKEKHILIAKSDEAKSRQVVMDLLSPDSAEANARIIQQASTFLKCFPHYKVIVPLIAPDTSAQARISAQARQYFLSDGISSRRVIPQPKASGKMMLRLIADSLSGFSEDEIPADYVKPVRKKESNDISILVKGRVIDGNTLKPIGSRLLFKMDGKTRSRAVSDPITGKFQTVLPAGTPAVITLFKDSAEYEVPYTTPDSKLYDVFQKVIVVNTNGGAGARFELGNDISTNRDVASSKKWNSFLQKKKSSRQLLRLVNEQPMPERFVNDLGYIVEIMSGMENATVKILTHTAQNIKDVSLEEKIAAKLVQYLTEHQVAPSRIGVQKLGNTKPKHVNVRHRSNTRVEIEINFK